MLFKNPNILYALFALLIPIIVHLFQLRRFQKIPFTNVAMLKKLELQTRKSAKLKKWLVLLSRMSFFAMLIIAFAKPYFPSKNKHAKQETLVYLDNSFSMQAQGKSGTLFQSSVQKLLETIDPDDELSLLTNTDYYPKQKGASLKKIIQNITYSSNEFDLNNVLLQGNQHLLTAKNTVKNFILLSDFQAVINDSISSFNPKVNYQLIKKNAVSKSNFSVENIKITTISDGQQLEVFLKNNTKDDSSIPVSIYDNTILIAKNTALIPVQKTASLLFKINKNELKNGRISIQDNNLLFDNTYYFSIEKATKPHVLIIGKDNTFLQKIYTPKDFKIETVFFNAIDYNSFNQQDVIIINGLEELNTLLKNNLKQFINTGGTALIIPSNHLKINSAIEQLIGKITTSKDSLFITKINYKHPILANVFNKKVRNFDYPFSTNSYLVKQHNAILQFSNGKAFISEKSLGNGKLYFISSALDKESSNFKNSPLIVPVLYNIALYNSKTDLKNLTINTTNKITINTKIGKDAVLQLSNEAATFIPQQVVSNNKVVITTQDKPTEAGIYSVKEKEKTITNLAFNYDRKENQQTFLSLGNYKNNHINIANSFAKSYQTIKENSQITMLWKWFALLALLFIILEILFLKLLK